MNYPELPYTIEQFREWLRSLPSPTATAGYSGLPRCCPAANWLNSHLQREVSVDCDTVAIGSLFDRHREIERYSAPEWLIDFQDKVDGWPRGTDIGRRQALNLLTRAERIS